MGRSRRWRAAAVLAGAACARGAPAPQGAAPPAAPPAAAVVNIREDWPAAAPPPALVVVDGVRYAARDSAGVPVAPAMPAIHVTCVARIEAVRGGAARARFGPGAEAGVVVVTRKPSAARPPGGACPPAT